MIEDVILCLNIPRQTKTKYIDQARQELIKLEEISQERYFNNFKRVDFLFYKILGREYQFFNIKSKI